MKSRGFTLIEAMVVMVVVVTLVAAGYAWLRVRMQDDTRGSFVILQAREMRTFGQAASEYVKSNKAAWPANIVQTITPSMLISVGLLNTGFAERAGAIGITPTGEQYAAYAMKDATGAHRIVIADLGGAPAVVPATSRLRRAGLVPTADSVAGFKSSVASRLTTDFKSFAGTVAQGTTTAKGAGGSFTQDLSQYLGSSESWPTAVALVDWPEYSDGSDDGAGAFQGDCVVVGANANCRNQFNQQVNCDDYHPTAPGMQYTWSPPTCPAGYTLEDGNIALCPSEGEVGFRQTPVGATLSYGTSSEILPVTQYAACSATCAQNPMYHCNGLTTTYTWQSIRLNDYEAARVECRKEWTRNYEYFIPPNNVGCGYGSSQSNSGVLVAPGALPANQRRSLLCCREG